MTDIFKTIIEPFRIKMVEPLKITTKEERTEILQAANHNLFLIDAKDILIDLLTDSGTTAMSAAQWGRMLNGDESYAGCKSFYAFKEEVQKLMNFKHVFPTHQGRAAERILFSIIINDDQKHIMNNNHFDTTRANIEQLSGNAVDLVIDEGKVPELEHPFKGNLDLSKVKNFIEDKGAENIPMCMITVTNNSGGGQPVSMENIREVSKICKEHNITLFFDACRFAENAWFIKTREEGYQDKSVKEIVQEMFSYVDGCTMSAKKDALVNIGGFLAFNDDELAEQVKNIEILTEGYPTYGGLAGRDLEAMAQGLEEVISEDYLHYRISSTKYLGDALTKLEIPVMRPIGGHAVYIDAKKFLPHIPPHQFPAQALACELYLEGGIRSVEIGSLMFDNSEMELLRLAIPRRVYTQSHIDYVIEVLQKVKEKSSQIKGLTITKCPPYLRHFSAHLEPVK
ncbi:MAG: tryptophanase [Bdellovibrionales bacterium]|nr:tryptophanase [Bdellovibrionales bacterium]